LRRTGRAKRRTQETDEAARDVRRKAGGSLTYFTTSLEMSANRVTESAGEKKASDSIFT